MALVQRLSEFYSEVEGHYVCEGICVCHLYDYVWMHAVSITECSSIQYKNNCESM